MTNDQHSNCVHIHNELLQQRLERSLQQQYSWLEEFYREHPEIPPSEHFKHRDDPEYWKTKPCWKGFLQSVVFFLTGIIIFPTLWDEQHPMYQDEQSTS